MLFIYFLHLKLHFYSCSFLCCHCSTVALGSFTQCCVQCKFLLNLHVSPIMKPSRKKAVRVTIQQIHRIILLSFFILKLGVPEASSLCRARWQDSSTPLCVCVWGGVVKEGWGWCLVCGFSGKQWDWSVDWLDTLGVLVLTQHYQNQHQEMSLFKDIQPKLNSLSFSISF